MDENHALWCINRQIIDLLEGVGAQQDHDDVVEFFRATGLPEDTVRRLHRAITCAEV